MQVSKAVNKQKMTEKLATYLQGRITEDKIVPTSQSLGVWVTAAAMGTASPAAMRYRARSALKSPQKPALENERMAAMLVRNMA